MASRQSAVREQSGEPVHPSGPVLGHEPTPLPTADRTSAACLLYPSLPKTGPEFEGGALIGSEAAVPLSCFINERLIDANDGAIAIREPQVSARTIEDYSKVIRKRGCGQWTMIGTFRDGRKQYLRLNCKCWDCAYCGPRRANRCRKAIMIWAVKMKLCRMMTLTLDPKKLDGEDSTRYINRAFAKLRDAFKRKYGHSITFIRVLEFQKNGTAHFHVLVDRYIDQDWLSTKWQRLGGGWHVDMKWASIRRIANYVSKYFSKELLISAPKRSRRVTVSRGIHLFEKPAREATWALAKESITSLRSAFETVVGEIFCQIEGMLICFTVQVLAS
jgi:hypothetical protein